MLSRNQDIAVCVAICLLPAVFIAGRMTAPKSTREIKAAKAEKKTATTATVETAQAAIVQTRIVTKYVDRVVTRPDGTKIETRESIADSGVKNETKAATKASETKIVTQTKIEYRDRFVAFKSAPRFSVAVNVSSGLDLKPHYGVAVGVRVLGPAWLTLGADAKSRALILSGALVF